MTREEKAFKRLHSYKAPKSHSVQSLPTNPTRKLEVSGGYLHKPVYCLWEQKHGVWFMMSADKNLRGWMEPKTGVLCEPSMERFCRFQNLSFRWL